MIMIKIKKKNFWLVFIINQTWLLLVGTWMVSLDDASSIKVIPVNAAAQ